MKYISTLLLVFITLLSCSKKKETFTIAFGSCNNQALQNNMWSAIEKNNPDVWIWGGDIIYSDTEDMAILEANYSMQKQQPDYASFEKNVEILGTWDDHDYGLNDGGSEYTQKEASQQLLLDFLNVPKNDKRREQEGVYFTKTFKSNENAVKVFILDTRYFRTALTPDTITNKRYVPTKNTNDSMLGEKQWEWLNNELASSKANFNVIMSSIQFLSAEHGYESWGNMPLEVEKMETIIKNSKAKNVLFLSGDRHISEVSRKDIAGLNYPLIDFTSSGMTHSYDSYSGEPNKYRIVDVVSEKSFGIVHFNFSNKSVQMEIRGENNTLYQNFTQIYNQ